MDRNSMGYVRCYHIFRCRLSPFAFIIAIQYPSFAKKVLMMKTIRSEIASIVALVITLKKRTDLLIVQLTNLKTYATIEAIIKGMAN
jgi:hypothetical protein